jgi:hypothetical protein
METITPGLILALSLLCFFLILALFLCFGLARWVLYRQAESQKVAMEALDKMARKVLSLSERPSAQQLAAIEATRMLRGDDEPQMSDEHLMVQ